MSDDSNVVLVLSNRLPVTAIETVAGKKWQRSSGGLATGLSQLGRHCTVRWYGWSGGKDESREVVDLTHWEGASLSAVPLNEEEVGQYYRGYCNSVLWPMLHGMTENVETAEDYWHQYVRVNIRFAHSVLGEMATATRIWVHDFHLMMVPQLLRGHVAYRGAPIAFFLHTPFPTAPEFLQIGEHAALIHGVLGADVIGFHTEEYAENFLEVVAALGYSVTDSEVQMGTHVARVAVRPMGIDTDAFTRLGSDPDVLEDVARLRRTHKKILLGVDRLDYTKGIPQRLVAFETLLYQRPELRGRVSLLQIAVPTRADAGAYIDLRNVVEESVKRINQTFGTPAWTPVEYLYDTVDVHTLAALYRAADVMLVTPSRDGLNLVAKEFVATRVDGDGVLILSKFAGAAKELTSALQVDPHAITDLVEALQRAITMPLSERNRRMREMLRAVTDNAIGNWIRYFVGSSTSERKPRVAAL